MKKIFFLLLILSISNCSVNEKTISSKDIKSIENYDFMKMTFQEYNNFIINYVKKSKYPRLEND